jgi:hypothetical protein
MPESIDATLAAPAAGPAEAWTMPVGASHQPRLSLEELTGLIAAFAVESGRARAAGTAAGTAGPGEDGSPARAYHRLIEGELDRAALDSAARAGPHGLDDVVTRIGYLEQAASAALVTVARRRDAANQSMWRTLAEAKAIAASWRRGPGALGLALATLATGGTNRSTPDDLVISLVRSHAELEQTRRDERRTAAIAARLDDLRSGAGADVPTTALLAAGASRGPSLPTSEEVAAARRQERLDALLTVISDLEPHTTEGWHRTGLVPELAALPRGRSAHTRLVESEVELRALFATLAEGAEPIVGGTYPGSGFRRPDGVLVFIREHSSSGGATIDLVLTDGSTRKVHIR